MSSSTPGPAAALYPSLMGTDWNALAPCVRRFHGATCDRRAAGRFQIHRGRRRIARLFASLLGFPKEGRDVATQLTVEFQPASLHQFPGHPSPGREIWKRNFANQVLSSLQYMKEHKILAERFGMIELSLRLYADDGALLFQAVGAALVIAKLRLALPSFVSPRIQAKVKNAEGFSDRFNVSVEMALPLIGPVLCYEGYLEPEEHKL